MALTLFDQANGKQVATKDATQYEVVALGLPNAKGGFLFDTVERFDRWGEKSPHASMLAQHGQRIKQLQTLDAVGQAEHLAHRTEVQRRVERELASLSISTGLPINSEKLLRQAMQDPKIKEIATDPISLYRGQGFTGSTYTLWGDHPNFSQFGFNNATSSLKLFVSPFGTLFDQRWYRGRRLVMFAVTIGEPPLPWFEAPVLADVGFDNVASSYAQVMVLF